MNERLLEGEAHVVFYQLLDPVHDIIAPLGIASANVPGLVPPIGSDRLFGRSGVVQVTLSPPPTYKIRQIRVRVERASLPS